MPVIKTNEDITRARDYGVQAFRANQKKIAFADMNFMRLIRGKGEDAKLIKTLENAWDDGWFSASRAEFI